MHSLDPLVLGGSRCQTVLKAGIMVPERPGEWRSSWRRFFNFRQALGDGFQFLQNLRLLLPHDRGPTGDFGAVEGIAVHDHALGAKIPAELHKGPVSCAGLPW